MPVATAWKQRQLRSCGGELPQFKKHFAHYNTSSALNDESVAEIKFCAQPGINFSITSLLAMRSIIFRSTLRFHVMFVRVAFVAGQLNPNP